MDCRDQQTHLCSDVFMQLCFFHLSFCQKLRDVRASTACVSPTHREYRAGLTDVWRCAMVPCTRLLCSSVILFLLLLHATHIGHKSQAASLRTLTSTPSRHASLFVLVGHLYWG